MSRENGVYRVENGGWGVLVGARWYLCSNRDTARDKARNVGFPITPKGTVSKEEVTESKVRKYRKRNWNDLTSGQIVTVSAEDVQARKRLYMSAYMHRKNHPESNFDFATVKEEGIFGIQVI